RGPHDRRRDRVHRSAVSVGIRIDDPSSVRFRDVHESFVACVFAVCRVFSTVDDGASSASRGARRSARATAPPAAAAPPPPPAPPAPPAPPPPPAPPLVSAPRASRGSPTAGSWRGGGAVIAARSNDARQRKANDSCGDDDGGSHGAVLP